MYMYSHVTCKPVVPTVFVGAFRSTQLQDLIKYYARKPDSKDCDRDQFYVTCMKAMVHDTRPPTYLHADIPTHLHTYAYA